MPISHRLYSGPFVMPQQDNCTDARSRQLFGVPPAAIRRPMISSWCNEGVSCTPTTLVRAGERPAQFLLPQRPQGLKCFAKSEFLYFAYDL